MRLNINGHWEPVDFIETFEAIESLYFMSLQQMEGRFHERPQLSFYEGEDLRFSSYEAYLDAANKMMLERARRTTPKSTRLYIRRINFASPGGIDFAGFGQAMESVDRIVGRLVSFFTEKRVRAEKSLQAGIETDVARQNLLTLKIENARRLLELRRDFPEDEHLIAIAVRDQDRLGERIAEGLITDQTDRRGV